MRGQAEDDSRQTLEDGFAALRLLAAQRVLLHSTSVAVTDGLIKIECTVHGIATCPTCATHTHTYISSTCRRSQEFDIDRAQACAVPEVAPPEGHPEQGKLAFCYRWASDHMRRSWAAAEAVPRAGSQLRMFQTGRRLETVGCSAGTG